MRSNFEKALAFCLKWEGGYTNDPDDPGGETNFGINKRDHPKEDIKNMTCQRAAEIYLREYWIPVGGDTMLSPKDIVAFDSAVNCGVTRAKGWAKAGTWQAMIDERDAYYRRLAEKKPVMKKFLRGWLNRTRDLRKLCESIVKKNNECDE